MDTHQTITVCQVDVTGGTGTHFIQMLGEKDEEVVSREGGSDAEPEWRRIQGQ